MRVRKIFFSYIFCTNFFLQQAYAQSISSIELPQIDIIATSPMGGVGVSIDQFPGNAEVIFEQNFPNETLTISELLNQTLGSVNINDTQGNSYQVDLNYRGFTSSPILGTPQGLSIYLDGIRINEPFGDLVSWDIIPQVAISSTSVIPGSNPIYGLNTLGGAIAMETKSGFSYIGNEVKLSFGSFSRKTVDLQTGGNKEGTAYYFGASSSNDGGWALYNPSQIRQLFTKLSHRTEDIGLDFSIAYSESALSGNQTIPISSMSQASFGYSHPDYVNSKNLMLHLKGSFSIDFLNSLETSLYYRGIRRDIFNSNIHEWLNDSNTANSSDCYINSACPASNLLTSTSQKVYGSNWEISNRAPVLKINQILTIGGNAEYGKTSLSTSGQNAYLDIYNHYGTNSVGGVLPQAAIVAHTRRIGIFLSETASVTDRLTLSMSARYDYAQMSISGLSCTDNDLCTNLSNVSTVAGTNTAADVSGKHTYQRLNPSFGFAYKVSNQLTTFANYSEGLRIPSAIELACSDPSNPCSGVPNAFSADPELKAVKSKTYEIGFRGRVQDDMQWKAAIFLSNLLDDILFNQANATQGYFSNVGQTRRDGLELSTIGKYQKFEYGLSATYLQATFQTPFTIANTNNSECKLAGSCTGILAQPGNRIPGIPNTLMKLRLGYRVDNQTRIGTSIQAQGSIFARGDENNLDSHGQVPGFITTKIDFDHQVSRQLKFFGGVYNIFNQQYSTFGILATNNLTSGNPEQFRGVAAPRSVYVGLRSTF